jgi:hypothetical protein
MIREDLADLWRQRLADHAASKLTVQDWCDRNRLAPHLFYYWRRRLAGAADAKSNGGANWLAIDLQEPATPASTSTGVSVRIGSALIEVQAGFDSCTLRAVVQVLETPRC